MDADTYQWPAARTIKAELGRTDLPVNAVMGLCGESGEVIDLVKKHLSQGHPLNEEALVRELGDVAWYLAETATVLGADLSLVLERTIEKLERRFPDGFSGERSMARDEPRE